MNRFGLAAIGRKLVLLALLALGTAMPAPAASPRDAGPKALVMTYYVQPKDRLAFRRAVEAGGAPLAAMRAAGRVGDYQRLWNRYVDDQSWTMMTFVQFSTPAELARWRDVEARTPAGLSPAALALVRRIETAPADLMREARSADLSGPAPVYLVVPYDYLIGTDAYVDYVDGYVVKQLKGWIDEGVLRSYRFYLARYGAVRPWSAVLLLEYRGDEGLGERDAVVAKVRKRLAEDSDWARLAAGKEKIREERTATVADPLEAR